MAKLIYSAITSLDGYVTDEDGNFDWAEPDEEVHAFVNDLERPIGTYLYGRRIYEVMAGWETMHTLADQTPHRATSRRSGGRPTRSSTPRTLETVSSARTRIERDFDPDAVRRMKAEAERDISIGGADLPAEAIRAGLVDELHLFVNADRRGRRHALAARRRARGARAARRAPLRQRRGLRALPHERLAVAFGRDVHDRRVDRATRPARGRRCRRRPPRQRGRQARGRRLGDRPQAGRQRARGRVAAAPAASGARGATSTRVGRLDRVAQRRARRRRPWSR